MIENLKILADTGITNYWGCFGIILTIVIAVIIIPLTSNLSEK